MHIKKLEISGFKSFVDRTVIHFDHDVIAIVGPNGCGKSNVVDAIRWCMGEQSAKHLRGRAMEDVIFNGSESRPPHGLAEVTITFDNGDASAADTLPAEYRDFPEIAVTRRLFRDGTSEYLLNKTQVRLRDVTELFLGTGVGTKAYSIVEQGRIGQIVSARPEDRRLFIEEAAGITKYKQRRRQAERKMDATRQNLARINDIVGEIERSRSSLKRQVAKAERFVRYRAELDDLVLHQASHRLLEFTVTGRVEREQLAERASETKTLRSSLQEAEDALSSARRQAAEIEKAADEKARGAFDADNQVTQLLAEIERSFDRLNSKKARLGSARSEQDEIAARSGELRGELNSLQARISELAQDEGARQADADTEDANLARLRASEEDANQTVVALRERQSKASTEAAATRARIDGLSEKIVESRARREALLAEKSTLAQELEVLEARKTALERRVLEARDGKRITEEERDLLTQELSSLRTRLLKSERKVDTAKNEINFKRNRLEALQDLHRRLEGVGAGARALLQNGDDSVLGIVADRIEAPLELTTALAGLLGERLQYVIVDAPEHGLALLKNLRRDDRGRAHVIALTTENDRQPSDVSVLEAMGLSEDAEVHGLLQEKLRYQEQDAALVRALVGDAILVGSADKALEVAQKAPGAIVVAMDGTVIRDACVISGGSSDDVAAGMLEQKSEMHTLGDELAVLEARFAELSAEHQSINVRLAEVETSLEEARQGAHQGELAQVALEKDLSRTHAEAESERARQLALQDNLTAIDLSTQAASDEEQECRSALDVLTTELEHATQELAKGEELAEASRERATAQATLVTERRVRLIQVKEQMEAAQAAQERVAALLAELSVRSERLEVELVDAATVFGETAARIVLAREARIEAAQRAKLAHAALDAMRTELEQVRRACAEQEAMLRESRSVLESVEEAARSHEIALQRMEIELEHLLQNTRERFRGLDLRRVVGDYHARPAPDIEHQRRIDELTQLIDRMGPVNLEATAEYEDAERRYTDLNTQKVDVESALVELERAIRHMNKESKRRFRETFATVNELFKKTFTKMFRGGRAELCLTNPEDILESGVDIRAQPPGKKLGNIELMSGGEKALTAVSMIFAIFQYKPSPFCVLDEVDAPLDEANVARYNEAIRNMTDRSQFILITHVRQTMQRADVLYGVTMGDPGVSRLVSVKVNDDARARSQTRTTATTTTSASEQDAVRTEDNLKSTSGAADDDASQVA